MTRRTIAELARPRVEGVHPSGLLTGATLPDGPDPLAVAARVLALTGHTTVRVLLTGRTVCGEDCVLAVSVTPGFPVEASMWIAEDGTVDLEAAPDVEALPSGVYAQALEGLPWSQVLRAESAVALLTGEDSPFDAVSQVSS